MSAEEETVEVTEEVVVEEEEVQMSVLDALKDVRLMDSLLDSLNP